jgi:uncharacterized membrane protein
MPKHPASLLVIVLLGALTYATRAGGYWLARRVTPGPLFEAWLRHLPGAVFVALVVPMVLSAGPAGWAAAVGGFATMRATGRFTLALLVGLGLYVLLARLVQP